MLNSMNYNPRYFMNQHIAHITCPAHLSSLGWTTLAIWAAITKYTFISNTNILCIVRSLLYFISLVIELSQHSICALSEHINVVLLTGTYPFQISINHLESLMHHIHSKTSTKFMANVRYLIHNHEVNTCFKCWSYMHLNYETK